MSTPGFTAHISLYSSTGRYRATLAASVESSAGGAIVPTQLHIATKLIGRGGLWGWDSGHSSASDFAETIHTAWYRGCDKVGSRCCGPDSEVKTKHCHKGVGCNVATGECEACGGPGQVCCDGDFTGFSLKGYTGWLRDPTERIQTCDDGLRCDARLAADGVTWIGSRRCSSCGDKLGGSCCAPDASYGLGRCFSDTRSGRRLACNDPYAGSAGTCVACGQLGEPACINQRACDGGTVEHEGTCIACGLAGQLPCDWTGCDKATTVYDWKHNVCVAAGDPRQPCRVDGGCNPGAFCDATRTCMACGWGWSRGYPQVCCPASTGGPECFEGTCQRAGDVNRCLCGYEHQRPCATGCKGGFVDVGGTCGHAPPPPPPPPAHWKTCNGEDWGLSTMDRVAFIRQQNECVVGVTYKANSVQEAYACARRDYGEAAVSDPVYRYTFALTSAYGCSAVTILATGQDAAETCAQSQCVNCAVTPGGCF